MASIACAGISCVGGRGKRIFAGVPAAGVRNVIRLFAVAVGGALLAACAQSSVVTRNSGFVAPNRQASLGHHRTASFLTNRRIASTKKHTQFWPRKNER